MTRPFLVAIVDDDESIRFGLSSLARSVGYAVTLSATAEAFLSELQTTVPDCVIADIQMPGIGGLELQRILKQTHPSLPIVIMTAFPEDSIREKVISAGAVCFLSKPFDGETILNCLADAIDRRSQNRE
jgi:FixJ family two-component response regulator